MNTHVENRWHFGIPVLDTVLPDFEAHQQALIDVFLAMRAADEPDMIRSNQGGWHSLDNLHTSDNPEIKWLTQQVFNIGSHCVKHLEGAEFNGQIALTNLWVNINRPGDWNMPHSHLPNEWSGVVYISVNKNKKNQRDGDLIFMNPMPMGKQYRRPASISYTPENGKFFLFPGYLLHMVAPHFNDEDRISVAFNFKIQHAPPNQNPARGPKQQPQQGS